MPDCCSTDCDATRVANKKHPCPLNHREYRQVPVKTVLHHIRHPWEQSLDLQSFYFCDDPDCDAVYFDAEDNIIRTSELRSGVGIKQNRAAATLCYCFDITFEQASLNAGLKKYVIDRTANGMCECSTRNPSGKCCLKDFP
jgi:hypothetical protein